MKLAAQQIDDLADVFALAWDHATGDKLRTAVEAVADAAVMTATDKRRRYSQKPQARDLDPIVAQVASAIGTTVRMLRCLQRVPCLSQARHVACWLLRQENMPWPRLSYPLIALALGMVNHTSALHGARRVERDELLLARAKAAAAKATAQRMEAA